VVANPPRYDVLADDVRAILDTDFLQISKASASGLDPEAVHDRVTGNLADDPGIPPENVMIVITENTEGDWSFGNGGAQFIDGDRE